MWCSAKKEGIGRSTRGKDDMEPILKRKRSTESENPGLSVAEKVHNRRTLKTEAKNEKKV